MAILGLTVGRTAWFTPQEEKDKAAEVDDKGELKDPNFKPMRLKFRVPSAEQQAELEDAARQFRGGSLQMSIGRASYLAMVLLLEGFEELNWLDPESGRVVSAPWAGRDDGGATDADVNKVPARFRKEAYGWIKRELMEVSEQDLSQSGSPAG